MSEKVEIEHPEWRGTGFQCPECKHVSSAPFAHPNTGQLLCEKCNKWRDYDSYGSVRYVAPRAEDPVNAVLRGIGAKAVGNKVVEDDAHGISIKPDDEAP